MGGFRFYNISTKTTLASYSEAVNGKGDVDLISIDESMGGEGGSGSGHGGPGLGGPDPNSDEDGDNLTFAQEQELGTAPDMADSDGDGINDDVEVSLGTNPTDPDSDRDGLFDGVESNTGIFVDWDNTGTNPLVADSDGDGYEDRREIEENTNPNDSSSHWQEPVDYGFLEVQIFPADYNFGDEPIARTHTKHHNSGDWEIILPPGNYKVKIHSHQSTYKSEWYKGTDSDDAFNWDDAFSINLQSNTSGIDVELGAAPSGNLSGAFRDKLNENATLGWPEITLHDPEDEEIVYWPGRVDRKWVHEEGQEEGYHSNDYTMVAPVSKYKLKIQFWDGSYQTSYYKAAENGGDFGTTSFDDATIVRFLKLTRGSPLAI